MTSPATAAIGGRRALLTTATGEPFQPVRLCYSVPNKHSIARVGDVFDPERFDLDVTNKILRMETAALRRRRANKPKRARARVTAKPAND